MSEEASALATGQLVGEDEYQAFYAVLAATARGRSFLDEHARRTRHAETDVLLAALKRLENQVAAQTSAPASPVLAEVDAVVEIVRSACAQIDATQLSATVTQVVSALETVQRRLAPLLPSTPNAVERTQPAPVQPPFAPAITAAAAQARASAQPEEPVRVIKAGSMSPPVFEGEDFSAAEGEIDESAANLESGPPSSEEDPLGPLMALSEEERLALFS
jgi:hypothetical protein